MSGSENLILIFDNFSPKLYLDQRSDEGRIPVYDTQGTNFTLVELASKVFKNM